MDTSGYMSLFLEESREHLDNINNKLLMLEKDNQDSGIIDDIFRSAHTLKGMAGTMGFNSISSLTHSMESVLDEVRKNQLFLSPLVIDLLFQCYDFLELCLKDIELVGDDSQRDPTELEENLKQLISKNTAKEIRPAKSDEQESKGVEPKASTMELDEYQKDIIRQSEMQGFNTYEIKIVLVSDCLLKSARAYIVFRELETLGEIIASRPSAEDLEDETFGNTFSLILVTSSDISSVRRVLDQITELESIEINQIETGSYKQVEQDAGAAAKENDDDSSVKRKIGQSIRVDIERLDLLMNLVSELIIVKNRIQNENYYRQDKSISESVEYLGRVTNDLHDAVMKVRMVPVEIVFNRFPRIVRSLAKETSKSVELITKGAGTEVDRTIIDELSEPLIHLIRNSVDHGLETPEERVASGKPETGVIVLNAYHEGNNVVIEVTDDGRGIDTEKIREQIIKKGLASEEAAVEMDESRLISYIFNPGFTTSESVSNISGRGVGLDVVKTSIESLGGVVEVSTASGKGTSFHIRLPITLSIIKALLVKVADEKYALPFGNVIELMEARESQITKLKKQELIRFRSHLIPVIRLDRLLECPRKTKNDSDRMIMVIVKKGDKTYALVVDDLIGQQEIVIKSLGKYLSDVQVVSGATILGDGSIALILDMNHVA
ncbi:MAG TPA: chemotaxis protein CheA [Candidatus Atribacteria bacterium]|nr:chemotaxis protein CheA [Candidatus Atribacteria bacterium]